MEIVNRKEVQTSSCPSADLAKLSILGRTIGYWLFFTEQSGSVMWVPVIRASPSKNESTMKTAFLL